MSTGSGQIPLSLSNTVRYTRDSFVEAPCNAAALALVEGKADWPGGALLLVGEEGSGKTHLSQVWAHSAGAVVAEADQLTLADVPKVAAQGRVVIERLDALQFCIADVQEAAERALFHLYNLLKQEAGHLLLTSRTAPAQMQIGLPDLASRLRSIAVAKLGAPDDALLEAVLAKLFADRQAKPHPTLIPYLLPRMERSLSSAGAMVDALDEASLARKKPLTPALARDVFDWS
ncbi:MAG: chromosomal replication initiator DnaA [Pseudomonadota bacterium]